MLTQKIAFFNPYAAQCVDFEQSKRQLTREVKERRREIGGGNEGNSETGRRFEAERKSYKKAKRHFW